MSGAEFKLVPPPRLFVDGFDPHHPMGAARLVRRERYAWPGGYALALVLDDGAQLCPDCVAKEWDLICSAHRHKSRDGWRPAGYAVHEAPETDEHCDHCDALIAAAAE